ncbi:hypothetical protein ACFX14_029353 [Malus domestica]
MLHVLLYCNFLNSCMSFRRLWFFVFLAFSLQHRKPSVLKEPCFPLLSLCALRKQATLIKAFYLQITSNNLIKVLGGIMRIHYRIGLAQQDREIWRGARGLAEGGLGASRLGYQDGVWVGLAVGHMGEGGDALRTHEAAQTLQVHHHQNFLFYLLYP